MPGDCLDGSRVDGTSRPSPDEYSSPVASEKFLSTRQKLGGPLHTASHLKTHPSDRVRTPLRPHPAQKTGSWSWHRICGDSANRKHTNVQTIYTANSRKGVPCSCCKGRKKKREGDANDHKWRELTGSTTWRRRPRCCPRSPSLRNPPSSSTCPGEGRRGNHGLMRTR